MGILSEGARQFPAHGPDADDSFYYRPSPERIGRIFVGLLGVGQKAHAGRHKGTVDLLSGSTESARR